MILKESQYKILVCKLLEICPTGGIPDFQEWPTIKVKWYYHWSELELSQMGIPPEDEKYLGENELFDSDHHDYVYMDSILGKCDVFSIQEYDNCESIDDGTYFCRSKFMTQETRLDPPFSQWETF